MIKIYNTLSRKFEQLIPIKKGHIGMYVCGPTVYGPGHIGHARTYIAFDIIRRYLEYKNFKVKYLVNITDVHDDMIAQANKEGITIFDLSERNIPLFLKDLETLGIKKPDLIPRVTGHINEIIEMVEALQKKGYAYKTDDGVYFSVSKFKNYGKLSNIKLKKSITGKRVQTDKYEKQNAMDFALWKSTKPNEPSWKSPWGEGRPGWHIECSAMSTKYLGKQFDIHGGAVDLVFPHHENEICQSEAYSAKSPFVKYWLHAGFLNVNGEKMSKSLGNFITIPQLFSKFKPMAFRYLISTIHYRSRVDFTENSIAQAAGNLQKWNNMIQALLNVKETKSNPEIKKIISGAREEFENSMDVDFNLPNAWATLYKLESKINSAIAENKISEKNAKAVLDFLKELNTIFGFFEFDRKQEEASTEVAALLKMREQARSQKNFVESDRLRNELRTKGIEVLDTAQGQKWKKLQG